MQRTRRQRPQVQDDYSALVRILQLVVSKGSVEERIQRALDEVVAATGVDRAALRLIEDDGALRLIASAGPAVEEAPPSGRGGGGYTRAVLERGETVISNNLTAESEGTARSGRLASLGYGSIAALPVRSGEEIAGILTLAAHPKGHFTPERVEFLAALSTSIGRFIGQARMLALEEARRQELEALNEITALVVTPGSLKEKAHRVTEAIAEKLGVERAVLRLYEGPDLVLTAVAGPLADAPAPQPSRAATSIETGQVVVWNDYVEMPNPNPELVKAGIRSIASFPVEAAGTMLGALTLASMQVNHFTKERVNLVTVLTRSIGSFIEQAKTLEENETRRRDLEALTEITSLLVSEGSLEEQTHKAMAAIAEKLGVERALLRLYHGDELRLAAAAGPLAAAVPPLEPGQTMGLTEAAVSENRLIVANDYENYERAAASLVMAGVRAAISIPVNIRDRRLGVLTLSSFHKDHFTLERVSLVTAISNSIGSFIEQARLLDAEQARTRELQALFSLAQTMVGLADPHEKIVSVLLQVSDLLGCPRVILWSADEEQGGLLPLASVQSGHETPTVSSILPFGSGTNAVKAYAQRQAIVGGTAEMNPRAMGVLHQAGIRTGAYMPVIFGDRVIAVLNAYSTVADHFTPQRMRLLSTVADALGFLLENTRLVDEIDRQRALQRRKDTFVSVASHELRTPMTTILGYAELLTSREIPSDTAKSMLTQIRRSSTRMAKIVSDLLTLSQIQAGVIPLELESVDVKDAATQAIQLVEHDRTRHRLSVDAGADELCVVADPDKLVDVLTNLLSNAVKYSPDGGNVVVNARKEEANGTVVVSVSDEGIGIAKDAQAELFTPFYRISHPQTFSTEGSGLGLSLVREYVSAMQGRVWVESDAGRGSTFFFSLPQASPEAAPSRT